MCCITLSWSGYSPSINLSCWWSLCFALFPPADYQLKCDANILFPKHWKSAIKWLLQKSFIIKKKTKQKNPHIQNADFFFSVYFSLGTEPGYDSHLWNCAGTAKPSYSRMGGYLFTLAMTTCNFFPYRCTISSCSRRLAFLCICSACSSSVWLNLFP